MLDMDQPNITRLEKGRVNPSIYLVKQICETLGVSIEELFERFKEN
jgi:DNA-binding XRE family transcriptional regulator